MNRIKKILAPTDLSELSLAGVRYALELARRSGAEVVVYYVVWSDEFLRYELSHLRSPLLAPVLRKHRAQLGAFLDRNFATILPLVELRQEVEVGIPEKNIVAKADGENFDLIVLSTHGRAGLSHMITGSVTENVVRHAPCPVLSIRPTPEEKTAKKAA
ncbi:MAG TPA: universal stress protein [Candidatus Binatia bacterium]|jgi:nucleotide-binding universal stress UspA family protein